MLSICWGSVWNSAGNIWAPLYCPVVLTVWCPSKCLLIQALIVSVCLCKLFVYLCHASCSNTTCCLCWQCTVKAASTLHDRLFRRLLLSPMHFFDTTPLGRILTRFSRDMDEGEAWFVLTVNLSLRRALSQWSHRGWQGVVPRHSVIWHGVFSLVSCSLLSASLASLPDMSICEIFFVFFRGWLYLFLRLHIFSVTNRSSTILFLVGGRKPKH